MRKLFFLISLVAAFGLGSCTQDDMLDSGANTEQNVTKMHCIYVVDETGKAIDPEKVNVEFIDENGTRANYNLEGAGYVVDGGTKTLTFTAKSGYNLTSDPRRTAGDCTFNTRGSGNTRYADVAKVRSDVKVTIDTAPIPPTPTTFTVTINNNCSVGQGTVKVGGTSYTVNAGQTKKVENLNGSVTIEYASYKTGNSDRTALELSTNDTWTVYCSFNSTVTYGKDNYSWGSKADFDGSKQVSSNYTFDFSE